MRIGLSAVIRLLGRIRLKSDAALPLAGDDDGRTFIWPLLFFLM
jgi:hypothetical protein